MYAAATPILDIDPLPDQGYRLPMKKTCLFFLPLVILAGCEENGGASSQEIREGARDAVNAPADYVGANVRAKQQAEVTTAMSSVNNAVRMFEAAEGRKPNSLNELVEERYLPGLPTLPKGASFNYDAQTGQVAVEGY